MRAAAIVWNGRETAAIETRSGYVPVAAIQEQESAGWSCILHEMIENGQWDQLREWVRQGGAQRLEAYDAVPFSAATPAPLLRQPRKIIGVGMNYIEKLAEMKGNRENADPVLFAKPDTSLIGPGEVIRLPEQSAKVTAEAELAIVIGKRCRNVSEADAPAAIAGFACSLDMTAADILAENPRYMYRAKSFDTFCSIGSQLLSPDELPSWEDLEVETVLNGSIKHRSVVSRMLYSPPYIISFLSKVMTLLPGDIILTGTPGSVVISPGDVVECRITGFASLANSAVK
ncbi:fumarylacetoacetate hydrolase family protein [Cohnella lubricantis]|uniref:Fumarylacetoacetate hydrolase family protein n=1 Tax=Cohnella lubricantis TaxID=2163172 RepID=A0A841TAV3_9BACL|nr:fumarylacetoacetate hydrolase family protein [Cohnella lubricantis]MBB6676380.1 fumarylacetoacetate hydrolase family protein [Cohnella lubricantis]MBP2117613.1 2-keto-4-pentenoate hydratase/2-oxohepta-3-ene-1,7-dioic acid hydratase in catechol pathway [Cohnella lubricantis]